MSELKNKIEALLFASGKGLPIEEIADYCEDKVAATKKVLISLHKEFHERDGSLEVIEHNGKWKMTVRGKYTEYIKKIVSETELPGAILKTLAVVAYKSPVLQSDVVHMRGQSAYDHIKQLAKQKFLTKDEEGRSFILRITEKFFNYFDVEGDHEIREIFAALKEKDKERRENFDKEQVEKQAQIQQKLGGLEVVESTNQDDHDKIFDDSHIGPVTKQKSEEDVKEEKQFLSSMDSKIDEIASRLDKHTLPKREQEKDESEAEESADEESTSEASETPESEEENYL